MSVCLKSYLMLTIAPLQPVGEEDEGGGHEDISSSEKADRLGKETPPAHWRLPPCVVTAQCYRTHNLGVKPRVAQR